MLSEEKLFEILGLVGSVNINRWSYVRKLLDIMPSIEVKEKEWYEQFKADNPKWYPLDLSKIKTWSTYDGECINLVFSIDNNKLICKASIYEGDNIYGYRKNLRFTATLIIPNSFIRELEQAILYELDCFTESSYESYLEEQKKIWMSNFKAKILGLSENPLSSE